MNRGTPLSVGVCRITYHSLVWNVKRPGPYFPARSRRPPHAPSPLPPGIRYWPKRTLPSRPTVSGECSQRFLSPRARPLIDRGDGAAVTRLDAMKDAGADLDALPAVFGEWRRPRDDEIRTEAIHRHRLRQTRVQVGQRAFPDQKQRVSIREAHRVAAAVDRIPGIDQTLRRVGHGDQTAWPAQHLRQPPVGFHSDFFARHRHCPRPGPSQAARGDRQQTAPGAAACLRRGATDRPRPTRPRLGPSPGTPAATGSRPARPTTIHRRSWRSPRASTHAFVSTTPRSDLTG